jgi:hypothetical protein
VSSLRSLLLGLVLAAEGLVDHVERHPLDYTRWTEPQAEYLACTAKRKLLRMGNGGGKSYVALADVVMRARKNHPFRPDWNKRKGPQTQWIVGVSWDQLQPLMEVFRSFLGEGELLKEPNWTPDKGWGKGSPTLVWPDGSKVVWKTMDQGARRHAGAGVDHILIDEPCKMAHYRECERRVFRKAGEVSLAMTPINAPDDLQWLRDMVTERVVHDMNYPMTEKLFRFTDGTLRTLPDGTVCNQAWINEQIRNVLPCYREIVIHGGWDLVVTDGKFSDTFSVSKHVHDFTLDGKEVLALGIDHGTQAFTETCVLVAVDERTEYPSVYVIDCYVAPENSPPEADAKAILAMLARHGLEWKRLKRVVGDIAHYGGRGKVNRKSNRDLAAELVREMKLPRNAALTPQIWTAKSGAGADPRGSVYRRENWFHRALLRDGQITIHPRCTDLIEAIPRYRGGSTDAYGHLFDGLTYSLDHWISRGQTRNAAPATLVVR